MPNQKRYNDRPILLTEGEVYLDGTKVFDDVTLKIKADIKTWTGKNIGSRGKTSTRITGVEYKGEMKRRKKTPWTRQILQEYIKNGKTPEFTITGIQSDKDSDYYEKYGSETVTAVGCVLTGEITLIDLDAEGDVFDDAVNFNIYDVNFS